MIKVPETVEEWHSPEIPVIDARAQLSGQTGFYLLQGKVSVGGDTGAGSFWFSHYDAVRLLVQVYSPDGERKVWLSLKCGSSANSENTLVELLNSIPSSGLEGAVGVHRRYAGSYVVNYIRVSDVVEAAIKGGRVTQIYAPPANATQPAP